MKKKTAVVTGAANGIGKAIASRLIEDGFFVIGVDIDVKGGKELMNRFSEQSLLYIKADISREEDVLQLFEKIRKGRYPLAVLVNNAGIIRDNLIWNMTSTEWDEVMSVNLKGAWLMCREAARIMKEQESGRIVNIASRAWLGNRGQSNYSASKAGLVALSRVLALELGKYRVTVNTVAPGLIDTPLTRKLEKDVLQKLIDAQPTRSMGKPEDVANAVSFFASEGSLFITGQTLYVDGGKCIGAGI